MKRALTGVAIVVTLALWCVPAVGDAAAPPDYAQQENWIRCPEEPDKEVDVFFMHPTCYFSQEDGMNASLSDAAINEAADTVVEQMGGVFTGACNLYAPRYRQASIAVLGLPDEERDEHLGVGLADMVAAFGRYLEHHNGGRPLILAGHSQGSDLTLSFLLEHRDVVPYDRLVAVYTVGWTVTDADLKRMGLPLAERPDQTRCVITWNTISEGGDSPVLLPGARCVNPLDWSTGHDEVSAAANTYALVHLPDGSAERIGHFTSARIDAATGGLVIPVPDIDSQLDHGMGA
ncbi:MAG: DUF3089 domain-containing protein, partial [bacterium]|nr:DUF3089 domain-containing protein [bacterium]